MALRKIAKINFQTTPACFVVEKSGRKRLRDGTVREFRRRLRVIKTELNKVRNVLLGLQVVPVPTSKGRRPGRPRLPRITAGIGILKQGMLMPTDLSPRGHWEMIFETQVVHQCIEAFDGLDEDGKKRAIKNLRQALKTRGGIGIPPEEK
jgi:hypothetical protein